MAKKQLCRKFFLLMWKNWILQKRHPWQTAVELLVPVVLTLLLVVLRSLVTPQLKGEVHYKPYQPSNMNGTAILPEENFPAVNVFLQKHKVLPASIPLKSNWGIAWSPRCAELKEIMDSANHILSSLARPVTFEGVSYPDSSTMYQTLTDPRLNQNSTFAAVAFQDDVCKNDKLNKKNLKMTIRFPAEPRRQMQTYVQKESWHTNELFPLRQTLGPREPNDEMGRDPGYWYQGFLSLQHAIVSALLLHLIGNATNSAPDILMQRFPYPSYVQDPLLQVMQIFVPVIFMIGFIYNCFSTIKAINIEKELQLKETMKIMGLPNWLHWAAWFIKAWLFQMISVTVIVILLTVPWYPGSSFSIFTFTHWSVLLVFLMLFMVVTICFDFMISVFFSKATSAALFGGVAWVLSFVPFMFMNDSYADITLYFKLLTSFASNTALGFGFDVILFFEGTAIILVWQFKRCIPNV